MILVTQARHKLENDTQEFLTFLTAMVMLRLRIAGGNGEKAMQVSRYSRLAQAAAFCVLLTAATLWAFPAGAADRANYIVVLEESVDHPGEVARSQTEQRDGRLGFVYRHALKGYSATLPKAQVESLRRDPRVDYVTLDDNVYTADAQSNPTGIKRIFAHTNTLLDIDEVDDERANVDVAVVDSGIAEHEELNIFAMADCVQEEKEKCAEGEVLDETSHGTHIAGTIGAIDDNEGVVGVAPGARLWAVKVLQGVGNTGSEAWALAGINWVVLHSEQIEVVNMSFGCTKLDKEGNPEACKHEALDQAISNAVDLGQVFVASAGNSKIDAKYRNPANHPDVITVSGIADYNGAPGGKAAATCANKGLDDQSYDVSNYGALVEVAAPAVCIDSTALSGGYSELSGTSMATPHVSGAAAVLASASNPANREDVEAIRETIISEAKAESFLDTSGDGIPEPLLYVGNKAVFDLNG